jgi:hypothetical protein
MAAGASVAVEKVAELRALDSPTSSADAADVRRDHRASGSSRWSGCVPDEGLGVIHFQRLDQLQGVFEQVQLGLRKRSCCPRLREMPRSPQAGPPQLARWEGPEQRSAHPLAIKASRLHGDACRAMKVH